MEQKYLYKNVVEGYDGWLFLYQGGQRQFDYLSLKLKIDLKSVENFISNISNRIDFCQSNNIMYHHIIFPPKPLVKSKYLPENFKNIHSLFETYYQDCLSEKEKMNIWYPLNDLQKQESKFSTFLKFDTHITQLAALYLTNQLLKKLDIDVRSIDYDIQKKEVAGDLCKMISCKQRTIENIVLDYQSESFYEVSNRQFLSGNTNETKILHNQHAKNNLRLLIFGDSFFSLLLRFLIPHFKDIVFLRSSNFHKEIISSYAPDIILTGNAERYLRDVKLDEETNNLLLALYGQETFHASSEYLDAFYAQMSYANYKYIYQNWIKEIKTKSQNFMKLRNYRTNKFLVKDENNLLMKFNSIGKNPVIVFTNLVFDSKKKYLLVCEFISSEVSTFKVLLSDIRDTPLYKFDRERVISCNVKVGRNKILLELDYDYLGPKVGIRPIQKVGQIEILYLAIERRKDFTVDSLRS